jgi:hypothetical protein
MKKKKGESGWVDGRYLEGTALAFVFLTKPNVFSQDLRAIFAFLRKK